MVYSTVNNFLNKMLVNMHLNFDFLLSTLDDILQLNMFVISENKILDLSIKCKDKP